MIVQALFAAVASVGFSVLFNVRGKNVLIAGINGGVGYLVYLGLMNTSAFLALFLASAAMSLYAELMARVRKAPATLFLIAGMIPIVPGGGMYRCMLSAMRGNLPEAAFLCYNTLLEAGAIAVGIIAVSSLMKLIPPKWQQQLPR